MEWIESLILGVVQGITEFLPVSSDGHLVITQQLFGWLTGRPHSGEENLFFDVMLHVGTLAAILVSYRGVVFRGLRSLFQGDDQTDAPFLRVEVVRVLILAIVATLPLIPLKLFFIDWIKATFQSLHAAGYGFLVTAAILLLVGFRLRGPEKSDAKGPRETTWLDALLVGLAQMFAPLPGVSRSGLTIAAALGLGFSRSWAVGFSLLIAVPAVGGAAASELKDALKDPAALGLTPDRVAQTLAATVVAGLVGYMAIRWLIRVVRDGHLWYFSVYLIALGLLVLFLASRTGGSLDDRPAKALERTAIIRHPGPPAQGAGGRAGGTLDHSDPLGPRPGGPRPGLTAGGRIPVAGTLLG
jgi:undecaprenyl-diphosphatase